MGLSLYFVAADKDLNSEDRPYSLDFFIWAGTPQMAIIAWFEASWKMLVNNYGANHSFFDYDGDMPDDLDLPYPAAVFIVPTVPTSFVGGARVIEWWSPDGLQAAPHDIWGDQFKSMEQNYRKNWVEMVKAYIDETHPEAEPIFEATP